MKLENTMTDETMLMELGERISAYRIRAGLTQAGLAEQAGVSKRTLERLEAGAPVQTTTLVRVTRALDLVSALDQAFPSVAESPLDIVSGRGKPRQRASRQQRGRAGSWTWAED